MGLSVENIFAKARSVKPLLEEGVLLKKKICTSTVWCVYTSLWHYQSKRLTNAAVQLFGNGLLRFLPAAFLIKGPILSKALFLVFFLHVSLNQKEMKVPLQMFTFYGVLAFCSYV